MTETSCRLCQSAETPPVKRLLTRVRRAVFGATAGEILNAHGSVWRAYSDGLTGGSWYQRHKDLFEATGDSQELVRMLRHVKGDAR